MNRFMRSTTYGLAIAVMSTTLAFAGGANKAKTAEPAWMKTNSQLVTQYNVQERQRTDVVSTGIESNLEPGVVSNINKLPVVKFAPGVTGRIYWGTAEMVNWMTMEPNSELPKEVLPCDRLLVMVKGSIEQLVNGKMVKMTCTEDKPGYYFSTGFVGTRDCVILEKGAENTVKAGPEGAEFLEVYGPVRLDYMKKAGATVPKNVVNPNYTAPTRFPANKVFNLYDVQYTELVPDSDSRLINTRGAQASLLYMGPGCKFAYHNHPEEQIMITFNGSIDEIILDGHTVMTPGDILFLPAHMVHGGINGPQGCNVMDVFGPVRPDYQAHEQDRYNGLNAIIPEGETPKLLVDGSATQPGILFSEGGAFVNGKLILSSMSFDIPAGTWKSDASKSNLVSLDPVTGQYSYIIKGMQTNGMALLPNGNLVVCNMAGHQILEVTPEGQIVRVIADKLSDGTRLDGPNDVVVDAKGGIYFSDPQFIFDQKMRPGMTVNYIKPTGEIIEVVKPGEFGQPNGIELSPDGKTLYVNNTYHDANHVSDVENWVIAYDVQDDGTIINKRKFAKMYLPISEYDRGTRSSCADGSAMDELGNLYEATNMGVQIFNPQGKYIGIIFTPTFPVNLAFGGPDNSTLYMMAWDKIYSIQTKVKGLTLPKVAK